MGQNPRAANIFLNVEAPGQGGSGWICGELSLPGISGHGDLEGMVAGSAGGMRGGFGLCLGLSLAVGGADLEGIFAGSGAGVPIVDVLSPGVCGELLGEACLVPGLTAVGGDLDALDAAVGRPGDAADRDLTGGEVIAILYGVDTGLGFDRAFFRPGPLDPVGVEVPVGELYLCEPLGGRDVAVEAGDNEPDRVAVLDGQLAAVQAEGDQRLAPIQRDLRPEARRKAVHAAADELAGGACDLLAAHAGLREHVREEDPGPAPVRDEPSADLVRDARERNVRLARRHREEVLVGELDRVVHRALDRELPAVHVYPGRGECRVYEVEIPGRSDQGRNSLHLERGLRVRRRQSLVCHGALGLLRAFFAGWLLGGLRDLQGLGAGRPLRRLTRQHASHADRRDTRQRGDAAEQEKAAAADRHAVVRVRLPGPHHRGAWIVDWSPGLRSGLRGPQAVGAEQELGDRGSGGERAQDGDHRGDGGDERLRERGGDGERGQDPHDDEGEERIPQAYVCQEGGEQERADHHGRDQDRYIRGAEELDTPRHELARCQLHDTLGQRYENGRDELVKPVDQLRDAEREDGPDDAGDSRPQLGTHSHETSVSQLCKLTLPAIHEQRMNARLTFHIEYVGEAGCGSTPFCHRGAGPLRTAQREAELRAVTRAALDADLATVGLDQAARYREPQAGAVPRSGAGPGSLAPERALEDARQIFGHYALPGVGYLDPHQGLLRFGPQYDRAVGRRVAERVAHEVVEHALQPGRVRENRVYAVRDLPDEAHALALRLVPEAGQGVGYQVAQRGFFQVQPQGAGVDPGELEEVVYKPSELLELAPGRVEIAGLRPWVLDDAVGDSLDQGARRGQGCAKVVRDGGDEIPPGSLCLSLARRRLCQVLRHAVEVFGEPRELVAALDQNLGVEVPTGEPRRPSPQLIDAPGQRCRPVEAEPHRQQRGEEQHRQQDRAVVLGDEHRPRTGEHHPEQQEAADEACAHEVSSHAPEACQHRWTQQEQRREPHPAACAEEEQRNPRQVGSRYAEQGRGTDERDRQGTREEQQRDA